jgi:CDP-4-dehydro-6-deoxyglucose reductase
MPQFLTLTRAARLVGVSRGTLQKRIKAGELATFEGMVSLEELLRAYPDAEAHVAADSMLEHVERIKDDALAKFMARTALPDAEVLAARATALSKELAKTASRLGQYVALVEELSQRLERLGQTGDDELRSAVRTVNVWLSRELEQLSRTADTPRPLLVKDTILRIMAASVRVLPSNHEFFLEGNDSILEAALRSGLALNYGCSNGNCGLCKARIISGEVKKIRSHDYSLSAAEKAQRHVLLCANTAITDLVIEAVEARGVNDIPLQEIDTRVKKLEQLKDDIVILSLQTPRSKRLRFLAGQHAVLGLSTGVTATHPIASCPCDDRNLQFHICRVDGDAFSDHVFGRLKGTDTVNILGPQGTFVLQEESPRPIILIAYETGFAPIKSLIEHAMALDTAEHMHLYWVAERSEGHYLNNLCRSWADALDNFDYTPLAVPLMSEASEQLLAQVLNNQCDLGEHDVYVAGPEALTNEAEFLLLDHGLPSAQLYIERMD